MHYEAFPHRAKGAVKWLSGAAASLPPPRFPPAKWKEPCVETAGPIEAVSACQEEPEAAGHMVVSEPGLRRCGFTWGTFLTTCCLSFPTCGMGITGAEAQGSDTKSQKWHDRSKHCFPGRKSPLDVLFVCF